MCRIGHTLADALVSVALPSPLLAAHCPSSASPGWRLLSLACVQVRLVILYALRFEGDSLRVRQMIDFLGTLGIRER